MYQKKTPSWIKHLDFEIIDSIFMEICFGAIYVLRHRGAPNYLNETYLKIGLNLFVISWIVSFLLRSYKDILVRNKWQECTATLQHVTAVYMLLLFYEYLVKEAEILSRTVFFASWGLSLILCYFGRVLWKKYLRKRMVNERPNNQMLVITSSENAEKCIENLYKREYREYDVRCIAILESSYEQKYLHDIPVIVGKDAVIEYIRQEIVDEVVLDFYSSEEEMCEWVDLFLSMGITVHISMGFLPDHMPNRIIQKIGNTHMVTTSIKTADAWELACKRLMDIIGGCVGLIVTGIAYIIVAPAIKIASPGPVFFKQERVGKNGRIFNIYKFRSMYMDAEERKEELMKYNEMQGLMFKMENDPRIIGSEKGPGKGIGNFIRKTSIDELPQFWNILKGDMSLVGTRPPTLQEYKQYKLQHKIRLSIKPGLTGLWQVSGRSTITDFEEVVKLDTEYIENWSLKYDLKILIKTVKVVIMRVGSR